ncbi:MAG: hypothetical protein AB8G86_14710 [Saprospiraceae bacterium]
MAELKFTKHLLKKIEELFEEMGYTIRYAKGSFNSGYCIVENQKVAVINKFFDTEGRVGVLLEILSNVEVDQTLLTEKGVKTYKQVAKHGEKEAEAEETETETKKAE